MWDRPPTWVSAAAFPPLSVPKPLDFDGGVVGIGVGSYSAYPWFSLLAHLVLFLPLLLFLVLLFQFNGYPRLVCNHLGMRARLSVTNATDGTKLPTR